MLGIGTYKLDLKTTYDIVREGLHIGYRLIDTAELYKNEIQVKQAMDDSGVDQKDIFLITKIRFVNAQQVEERIKIFGQVNCLLIHQPTNFINDWNWLCKNPRSEIKYIGVSNFDVNHLQHLDVDIQPFCNQIEISPFWQRKLLIDYHKKNNILTIAHSPLTKGKKFHDPRLLSTCQTCNKNPVEFLLGWSLRQNFWTISRTSNIEHLKTNFYCQPISNDINTDLWNETFATHPQHIYL